MYPERIYMYISFLLNRSQAGTGLVRINQSTETSCILVHTSSGKTPYWVCVLGGWRLWLMKKTHLSHTLYKTSLNEGRRGGGGS